MYHCNQQANSLLTEWNTISKMISIIVTTLWNKWMARFKGTDSSEEVMAKVAFQFARLYSQAYRDNKATNELLTDFEKELDEIVIKI